MKGGELANLFINFFLIFLLFPVQEVSAARLPSVGGDEDQWGNILNEYLNVSHTINGTLKEDIINSSHIIDASIEEADIANGSINASHIRNGAIDIASKILDGIITGAKIIAKTITGDLIADDAINSTHISNGSVEAVDIATSAINSSHIADNSIVGDDISSSAEINITRLNSTIITATTVESDIINAGTLNGTNISGDVVNATTFELDLEVIQSDCTTALCEATASCSSGKRVIFGFRADNSILCDTIPLNCNDYCTVTQVSCTVTAQVSSASVYVVCGKVN